MSRINIEYYPEGHYNADMARPKKKPQDLLSETIWVKVTQRDRDAIEKAARQANMDTSTFVRIKVLEMIRSYK